MMLGLRLRTIGLVAATIFAAAEARAQSPAFMNAVAFALTGSDGSAVRVVDQANCVFMINAKTEGGRVVGEVFHLNNVQTDRLSIQPWQNIAGRWVEVALRGSSTVYEYTGAYQIDSSNSVMSRQA